MINKLWYKYCQIAKSAVCWGLSGISRSRLTRKLTKARNARLTNFLLAKITIFLAPTFAEPGNYFTAIDEIKI